MRLLEQRVGQRAALLVADEPGGAPTIRATAWASAYSLMSRRTNASGRSNRAPHRALAISVLPTPLGPSSRTVAIGRQRVESRRGSCGSAGRWRPTARARGRRSCARARPRARACPGGPGPRGASAAGTLAALADDVDPGVALDERRGPRGAVRAQARSSRSRLRPGWARPARKRSDRRTSSARRLPDPRQAVLGQHRGRGGGHGGAQVVALERLEGDEVEGGGRGRGPRR